MILDIRVRAVVCQSQISQYIYRKKLCSFSPIIPVFDVIAKEFKIFLSNAGVKDGYR